VCVYVDILGGYKNNYFMLAPFCNRLFECLLIRKNSVLLQSISKRLLWILKIMKLPIAQHVLFNHINQSNPTLFVDFREESLYDACHFRHAHSIRIEVCEGDGLMRALSHVSKRNKFMLIFVVDDSIDLAVLSNILSASEERITTAASQVNKEPSQLLAWSNFTAVEFVHFTHFFEAYPLCSSLFEGADYPGKRVFKHYSSEIVPNFLFLGSYYDATDEVIMREMRITHVVDATSEHMSQALCASLALTYLHIPVWDMEGVDIAQYFTAVLEFVQQAQALQGRVLIHCRAGISRSSTFVLVHLMHSGRARSLQEALKIVISERPYVLPNPSFRAQLSDYEETLFGTRSFSTDAAMLAFISTINFCWSGIFSAETEHDRIPIIAASQSLNPARLLDEYASPETEAVLRDKPKKTFLKRAAKVSSVGGNSSSNGGTESGVESGGGGGGGGVPVRAKPSFVRPQVGRVKKTTDVDVVVVVNGGKGDVCGVNSAADNSHNNNELVEEVSGGAAGTGACAVKALRSPNTGAAGRKVLSTAHGTTVGHSRRGDDNTISGDGELVHSVVCKIIGVALPPAPPADADLGVLLRDWRLHMSLQESESAVPVENLPPARLM